MALKDYQKKDIKKSPKIKATVKQEFDDGIIWAKAIKVLSSVSPHCLL